MTNSDLASAYVLGTLAADEREAARLRVIEDATFAAAVTAWEARLAGLAPQYEEALPEGLLERIEAAIDASHIELPGTVTRRAGTGKWIEVGPGLRIKILNRIESLNRHTFMAELQPGATYVDHDHEQDEEIYMISGDLIIGGLELRQGDFHVARAGKHHPVHRSRTGCLCIISQAIGPV
jgi:quercetin dioxygenase-like cupin family protein